MFRLDNFGFDLYNFTASAESDKLRGNEENKHAMPKKAKSNTQLSYFSTHLSFIIHQNIKDNPH